MNSCRNFVTRHRGLQNITYIFTDFESVGSSRIGFGFEISAVLQQQSNDGAGQGALGGIVNYLSFETKTIGNKVPQVDVIASTTIQTARN